jgi:hypothetical protein
MQTSEGVNAAALKAIARCNTFEKTVSMMLSRSDTLNNTHGMLLSADDNVALGFAPCLLTWLHIPDGRLARQWNAANDAKRQRAAV